jgi:hypothetical protein
MYVILREGHRGDRKWLVVEGNWTAVKWKLERKGLPMELVHSRHKELEKAVRTAISLGVVTVVATCKRLEDARILARESKRREQQKIKRNNFLKSIGATVS